MTDCVLHITGCKESLVELSNFLASTGLVCGNPDGSHLNLPLDRLLKALMGKEHNGGFVKDLTEGENCRDVLVDSKESVALLAEGLKSVYHGIEAVYLPACRFFPAQGNPADARWNEYLKCIFQRHNELWDDENIEPADFTLEDLLVCEIPILINLAGQHRCMRGMDIETLPEHINTAACYFWDAADQFDWRSDLRAFRKYCVKIIRNRFGDDWHMLKTVGTIEIE